MFPLFVNSSVGGVACLSITAKEVWPLFLLNPVKELSVSVTLKDTWSYVAGTLKVVWPLCLSVPVKETRPLFVSSSEGGVAPLSFIVK